MGNTSENFQKLADDAKKAEELVEGVKGSKKELEVIQVQIKNAQNDLALINFERDKEKKELEKLKANIQETHKVEGQQLAEIQLKRQEAEKEFGAFLTSVVKEKEELEEARDGNAKEMAKLVEGKTTNQSILDDKKKVLEETKKEKNDLESRRANAEAQISGMRVLEVALTKKDDDLKQRTQSMQNIEKEQATRNNELGQREGAIKQKEGLLEAREALLNENEQKAKDLVAVATEKETYLIKLAEEARIAGADPKAIKDVEKIKIAEPEKPPKEPKEEKVGAKKPSKKRGR